MLSSHIDRGSRFSEGPAGTFSAISNRRAPGGINRVQNGQPLNSLRAGGGPPAGVVSRNSGNTKSDGGRRNTSLFDLPSNGAAAIARLRGQVRASSPLTSLFGAAEGFSGGVQGAQSRLANLRSSFNRIDNRSRLLIGQSNPNRNPDGFGLQPIQSPSFSLFG